MWFWRENSKLIYHGLRVMKFPEISWKINKMRKQRVALIFSAKMTSSNKIPMTYMCFLSIRLTIIQIDFLPRDTGCLNVMTWSWELPSEIKLDSKKKIFLDRAGIDLGFPRMLAWRFTTELSKLDTLNRKFFFK